MIFQSALHFKKDTIDPYTFLQNGMKAYSCHSFMYCNCSPVSPQLHVSTTTDVFGQILCSISTCDAGHFVGEVALLQILKMSHQPLSSRRQGAVVPRLSFSLEDAYAGV